MFLLPKCPSGHLSAVSSVVGSWHWKNKYGFFFLVVICKVHALGMGELGSLHLVRRIKNAGRWFWVMPVRASQHRD